MKPSLHCSFTTRTNPWAAFKMCSKASRLRSSVLALVKEARRALQQQSPSPLVFTAVAVPDGSVMQKGHKA